VGFKLLNVHFEFLGMWWLSWGDVVAQFRGCDGSVEGMWWLSLGMWWLSWGDVVAQLAKARLGEPDCYAAVPGSIPASSIVS
jgi:hypothetical protein